MQAGDVPATATNTEELNAWVGFKPKMSVLEYVAKFVKWYWEYFKLGIEKKL